MGPPDAPLSPELVPTVVLVAPPALPMLLKLLAAESVPATVAPVPLAVETDVAVASDPIAAAVPVPTPLEDEDEDEDAVVVVSVVVPSGGSPPLLQPAAAMASIKSWKRRPTRLPCSRSIVPWGGDKNAPSARNRKLLESARCASPESGRHAKKVNRLVLSPTL